MSNEERNLSDLNTPGVLVSVADGQMMRTVGLINDDT